jgi:hypothetical protein
VKYHYGYIKFKDRVDGMNMFCLVSKVLHNKNVNAICSSCIYKLFQNYNYQIKDFFTLKILHKIMPLGFNATSTKV